MKVIGVAQDRNYIVEISCEELHQIMGFVSRFANGAPREIGVGVTYQVGEVWRVLAALRRQKGAIKAVADTLRHYADLLGPIDKVIDGALEIPEDEL
jgi:hypothetical protein